MTGWLLQHLAQGRAFLGGCDFHIVLLLFAPKRRAHRRRKDRSLSSISRRLGIYKKTPPATQAAQTSSGEGHALNVSGLGFQVSGFKLEIQNFELETP
jgi:hypothetical protein